MAITEKKEIIIEGRLEYWYKPSNDKPGFYVEGESINSILDGFEDRKVKITIELI